MCGLSQGVPSTLSVKREAGHVTDFAKQSVKPATWKSPSPLLGELLSTLSSLATYRSLCTKNKEYTCRIVESWITCQRSRMVEGQYRALVDCR